jgi:hypothetical protein
MTVTSKKNRDRIVAAIVLADAAVNAYFWWRLRPGARNWLFETNRQAMDRRLRACEHGIQSAHGRCDDMNSDLLLHIAEGHPSGIMTDPEPEEEP